jgi:hypothetical protein
MRALLVLLVAACGREASSGADAAVVLTDGATQVMTFVYAHSASALYRIDPDALTVTKVGDFSTGEQMSDIAINRSGVMIGISFTSVYLIDPTTAKATKLSEGLGGYINGMSFVPAGHFGQVGDDVLIATRNADGNVYRIDPTTGVTKLIGSTGTTRSSGDIVSVAGFGTMLTAENGAAPDSLVRLAPQTFEATVIGSTGFDQIWGVAYWKNRIFGFTNFGQFIAIDPTDGKSTLIQSGGPAWWGAAVITTAPVLY